MSTLMNTDFRFGCSLQQNGFFIECGAYDGETRSNTLYLERFRGWSGLLIEADPINFTKMLQKNRRAYLSPTCLSLTKNPMLVREIDDYSSSLAATLGGKRDAVSTTVSVTRTRVYDVHS